MKWFIDLKIKNKLLLSFIMLALIAAFIGMIGYSGLSSVADFQDKLATQSVPLLKNGSEIAIRVNQIVLAERGLINEEFKGDLRTAQYSWIDEKWELLNKSINEFERLEKTDKESKIWNDFTSVFNQWKNGHNELIRISREKDQLASSGSDIDILTAKHNQAFEVYIESKKSWLECSKLLENIVQEHILGIRELDSITDDKADKSRATVIIFSIVGGVAALVLGFLISRIITTPVNKVLSMAQELLKGHTNARADVHSKDELGEMAAVLDSFAYQLDHSIVGSMHKISEGDVTFQSVAADSGDKIAPVINRMTTSIKELITETKELTKAATEGNLSYRGNAANFKGGFREIIEGFNNTLDKVVEPIKESSEILGVLSTGDLTARMEGAYKGDFQIIKNSINKLAESMNGALGEVSEAVQATASAATQISSSSEEMAAGSKEQTSQTSEVASSVEEMTRTTIDSAKNAGHAAELSKQASESAENGALRINATRKGMEKIVASTKQTGKIISSLAHKTDQIGEITQVIDDIADQTNLLALNAAIEAARAGDQGRGFAVVADEVRKLAERTTKATKEIADTIKSIQKEAKDADSSMSESEHAVLEGMGMTEEVTESLKQILEINQKVCDMINQVAAGSEEQSCAAEHISKNIESISSITIQNSASAEQIARSAEDLSRLTLNLQELTNKFKLDIANRTLVKSDYAVRKNGKILLNK